MNLNIKRSPSASRGASPAEIRSLENRVGRKLPNDYVEFLMEFSGACPVVPVSVTLPSDECTNILMIYGTGDSIALDDRVEYYLDSTPEELPNSIAVAHDSGVNGYWMLLDGADFGSIHYIDIGGYPESNGRIADSWSGFLDIINDPDNWNRLK